VSDVHIRLVWPQDEALLDAAFELYRDSIERTEQRTEAEFRALAARADYRFLVAVSEDRVIGMTVSWVPADSMMWLFEYAAVAPEMRGRGLGANLFLGAREIAGAERTALVEVDAFTGEEIQTRRLSFYRGLGCRRLVGLDYILPLDAFGAPPPMWLLALTSPEDQPGVSIHVVESWLRAIYTGAYNKPLNDPRLARMIDPLPDHVELAGL
jgi:GNAT superfamily N-acetyltransferase